MDTAAKATRLTRYQEIRAARPDYGSQLEILVALLYHAFLISTDNAVDGGANSGLHATSMAGILTSGHLFCFEPVQRPADGLARNLESLGASSRSSIHLKALGEKAGVVEFLINDGATAFSHIRRANEKADALRAVSIPMVTIDDAVGASPIAFIKLDLEGADFLAIRGAERVLKRDRPLLVFETLPASSSRAYGFSKDDFFDFFARVGYVVHDLHGVSLTRQNWGDDGNAFEYFASHRDDGRGERALTIIRDFWAEANRRPVIEQWPECVMIVRDPDAYMQQFTPPSPAPPK